MAQPFDCFCGAPVCRGIISGASDMSPAQLSGTWINGHIRDLKDEQLRGRQGGVNGGAEGDAAAAAEAIRGKGVGFASVAGRSGPTSRELSGEMGGDTKVVV